MVDSIIINRFDKPIISLSVNEETKEILFLNAINDNISTIIVVLLSDFGITKPEWYKGIIF